MKQVLIDRYGTPWDVARCADVPDVGEPAADEVVFDVLAFPINPADMWFCKGSYRLKPPLPATPGAECVGRVTAVGSAVKHLARGDLVINLQRENWTQKRRVKGDDAIPLPAGIDLRQAAMVRINPPTARLMLSDFVDLAPGEWVIQNVANSAVGRLLIVQAHQRGLRTVNIVRRAELAGELKALGADVVLVDGDDLAERVAGATGKAAIRLGVEAIGGAATGRLVDCVATEGTVVHYGSMSGEDPKVGRSNLIYRGIKLTGFMLGRGLARRDAAKIREIYAELAAQVMAGTLYAPVDTVYPIEKIKDALAHADKGGRNGKILVAPNGAI
ncbi:zinc-dependent alcohol dehydrogenase family protein [Reyranella sp. MMS21-HV4-11]|uniref:Zinc-dependent alcohol dehydrogenase family protein n=1 Tax=Reyranella humidisoli TaxID=2849149 RepID=A0ABS6IPJ8_9HYPH|nr:zinc-dependent alcohol dehydrogenase family protein [Reyranella sp. MMS21-HV4-11]MBU8875945.1 zinc-dependent alcohol dehydrogenase family protein [Reyranella sp. MMS21-HV4-11]